ncbi:MAG: PhoU domain-containing protein [Acidimicrobiales bacterium]|nr:PhoU domain-containing protein [Acidimicrobiales bacterium]
MDDRPRNLRAMLAEAKDTSELMVDLAYASVYFNDPDMAEEVDELEAQMSEMVHDMRAVCVLAARSLREAEGMSSVLQVVSAIERIANDAVDISRIVTRRLGIPQQLVADLSDAEEVSHRVLVREGSHMAHRPLEALELTIQAGMRVMAVRRGRQWITDVAGDTVLVPDDVLFLRGSPEGITRLRELAAAPVWEAPHAVEGEALTDLDRAVDVLVEMKNLSEAAVGLAYSALVLADRGLAAEVRHLEDRLDEMKNHLELWVLRSAGSDLDPSELLGVLQLAEAAEDIGDQAQAMVWLIEEEEELHPILGIALGEADEVVVRYPSLPVQRWMAPPSRNCSSTSSRASRSWPFVGEAATCTGHVGRCAWSPATRSSPAAPTRAGCFWPACAAGTWSRRKRARTSWSRLAGNWLGAVATLGHC